MKKKYSWIKKIIECVADFGMFALPILPFLILIAFYIAMVSIATEFIFVRFIL